MSNSKIEWTDRVWNFITGCTKVSEGCVNCYAEKMTKRLVHNPKYAGGFNQVHFHYSELIKPLYWRKPSLIFVNSMSDTFHENNHDGRIYRAFNIIRQCPKHQFLFLTKRPDYMLYGILNLITRHEFVRDLKNYWLGVTVENQKRADERIPVLIETPCENRFLSIEPMLGHINIMDYLSTGKIKWVICGGESGHHARPVNSDWVRILKSQCDCFNIPFFFKSWGEYITLNKKDVKQYPLFKLVTDINERCAYAKVGKKKSGALLDGKLIQEFPEELKKIEND